LGGSELQRSKAPVDATLSGHGKLLLITGEADIGKTSLILAISPRAEAKRVRFALGRCYEAGSLPAFAARQELFTDLRTSVVAAA
jgi:hypothetical protein